MGFHHILLISMTTQWHHMMCDSNDWIVHQCGTHRTNLAIWVIWEKCSYSQWDASAVKWHKLFHRKAVSMIMKPLTRHWLRDVLLHWMLQRWEMYSIAVMYCMFAMIGCTYTGIKCYCVSRWLAWCSHGDCDIMVQIVVILPFWDHVYWVLYLVCVVDLDFLSCRLFLSAVLWCHWIVVHWLFATTDRPQLAYQATLRTPQ